MSDVLIKMHNLIYLVVASLLASTVQSVYDQSNFSPRTKEVKAHLHSTCVSKSGTDQAAIDNILKGDFTDEPKIKVYMRCLLTESGVITPKGLNIELVNQLLPEDIKEESIKNAKICIAKLKGIVDVYERAFTFFKCYYNQNPELFIFY